MVRPVSADSALRLWQMAASVSGSRALVASSRITSARPVDQGARQGDALALAAGEQAAPLADDGLEALGQLRDEVPGVHRPQRRFGIGGRR